MGVHVATSLADALAVMAADPGAHVLAGGTDLMVEVNFGHRRPSDGRRRSAASPSCAGVDHDGRRRCASAPGVTYAELLATAAGRPGARRWPRRPAPSGSPQIRNAGDARRQPRHRSPAGDAPARARRRSTPSSSWPRLGGARGAVPFAEFMVGAEAHRARSRAS